MQVYIVEYTTEDQVGNDCLQMEIEARNREHAWDILEENYPDLAIDCVYAREI
jgi:hypothetical protein